MKNFQIIFIFISLIFQSQIQAKIYTGIEFSEQEKALHLSKIDILTAEASKCLNNTYADHVNFFKKIRFLNTTATAVTQKAGSLKLQMVGY
jgi:hypothetical protein